VESLQHPPPMPTPPPMPALTLPSVQAPQWREITVETLCLQMEQSYPGIEKEFSLPIEETIRQILTGLGLQVVAKGTPCDATLAVTFTAKPLAGNYAPGGRCYTGAEVEGEMVLNSSGLAPVTLPISGEQPVPQTVTLPCNKEPNEAPFRGIWEDDLLDGLVHLWGPQVLVQALGDEVSKVSQEASQALKWVGPEKDTITALVRALGNKDQNMRERAAKALGDIGPGAKDAIPFLIQALGDKDENYKVRSAAAHALGYMEAIEAVPFLIQTLGNKDDHYQVRGAAARVLGRFGQEEGVIPILTLALEDENASVRNAAVWGLGAIGSEATPLLVQALKDENDEVRESAINRLRWIGPEAVPPLIQALGKKEEQKAAAEALKDIAGQDLGQDTERWQQWWEGISPAIQALRDENATLPALTQALEHDEMLVRWAAARVLGEMESEAAEASPALIQLLDDSEVQVRVAAGEALGQIGPEAIPHLVQAMRNENNLVRKWTAYALGNIGPEAKESVPVLIRALEDEDYDVAGWSAQALEKITGQYFGEETHRWQQWWEEQQSTP
jgi:HEAT repeat protein